MSPREGPAIDRNGDILLGASCIIKEASPQVIDFSAGLRAMERRRV